MNGKTTITTDIDDVETRDLIESGYELIKALKEVELRDPENVLRTMLEKLDEFRTKWASDAYTKGFAEGVAETLEKREEAVVRDMPEGRS